MLPTPTPPITHRDTALHAPAPWPVPTAVRASVAVHVAAAGVSLLWPAAWPEAWPWAAGAVLLTMGLLALFNVQLGILHLVGLLLVVAVGSNYALFFDMLHHGAPAGQGADPDTLASLLLANLTTVLSFGLIALSDIPEIGRASWRERV